MTNQLQIEFDNGSHDYLVGKGVDPKAKEEYLRGYEYAKSLVTTKAEDRERLQSEEKKVLFIDIETFSPVDLKKSGLYVYAESSEFEILLFAYAFDQEPVKVVDFTAHEYLPYEVFEALTDPSILKTAHNANFERICISHYLSIYLPIDQWECTAVKSAMLGLPFALAMVGKVLKIEQEKMTEGKSLIRYFSIPCNPTSANGNRRRNLPGHDFEKWETYKRYNIRDVEAEREIREVTSYFEIPESEKELYILDQVINDRGVLIDTTLVNNAIRMDATYKDRLSVEMEKLTNLDNPNSVAQLKAWIADETGEDVTSLTKESILNMLKSTPSDEVTRVLRNRQEMAKTSVKKYQAMAEMAGADGRIRGLAQFYGANRTGRWAGRGVQLQNLPQNHLRDLDLARQLVAENDLELLEILFGNVPDTLSQLIRTAFIAKPGHTFLVADFSAIEARVIAWLADETWRLEVFATHGKIYEASASQMFKVDISEVTKGSSLRQKGKVAELACIAEGQLVATNYGLVPIELVTMFHLVWDGQEFVKHGGVIYKGIKNVISYEGLTATEDHLVWIEGEQEPVQFGYAAQCGSHLLRSENYWEDLRKRGDYFIGKKICKGLVSGESINQMPGVPVNTMDVVEQFNPRKDQRVSELFTTNANTLLVGPEIDGCKAEVRESKGQELSQLRSAGNSIQVQDRLRSRTVDFGRVGATRSIIGTGQDTDERELREREYSICRAKSEPGQQTVICNPRLGSIGVALCEISNNPETSLRNDKGSDYRGGKISCIPEEKELEGYRGKAKVYDILNAGPRNRFTVSGVLVHNCGYGGGVGALEKMGAVKMGLKLEDLQTIIDQWRTTNPHIVKLWKAVDNAAKEAVEEGLCVKLKHGLLFEVQNNVLFIELPSGRKLSYFHARLGKNKFDSTSLIYEGMNQTTKQWCDQETYGGKLVENIVQAIARDCLAFAMLNLEKAGYQIVFHVHDEVIIEVEEDKANLEEVCKIMGQPIPWAKGLLLRADGYATQYYRKD